MGENLYGKLKPEWQAPGLSHPVAPKPAPVPAKPAASKPAPASKPESRPVPQITGTEAGKQ